MLTIPRSNLTPPKHRPADPEQQNDDRALWAEQALIAFMQETGTEQEDSVADLLCDLMHYCDRDMRLNFEACMARARAHYAAETQRDGRLS